jgi:tripartite-type tricarboxylate transporter receptor subunit TctC
VPAERVAIIRKAFNDTMQDKEFRAEMAKQQNPVNPMTGEEAEAVVAKMMSAPPAVVAKAKAIYE